MNGFEKEVDSLGRVVIPMAFRKELGIEQNTKVLITLNNGDIHMSPVIKHCALCNKKIKSDTKFRLCDKCIKKIKTDM